LAHTHLMPLRTLVRCENREVYVSLELYKEERDKWIFAWIRVKPEIVLGHERWRNCIHNLSWVIALGNFGFGQKNEFDRAVQWPVKSVRLQNCQRYCTLLSPSILVRFLS
jgi:hypothetical protein